ncbi:MAG: type IV pili methyl-accepting chemotaxis transducer N-terminal domain-containing protein [Epsilonproteobacteria bacterium]|nr:type IV pili methyl-accepting chemotaxis transducer N-terminal domain-containing protein [Campylobacterota bacterium]
MKHLITLLAFLLLFTSSLFALTDKELAISINLSGKQRMLSQKMTKESFLIRSDIDKQENIKKLIKSSQLFDKTLKGLMKGDSSLALVAIKSEEIQTQLKKVEKLWLPFYKEVQAITSGKVTDSSYDMLEQNNVPLLKEMNKAVGLYSSQAKSNNELTLANDINLAGKQRMLTQKMGKALLFASNDFKKEAYINDFKASRKLFTQTLEGLFNGSKTLKLTGTDLPKITTQLKVVQGLWQESQPLLDNALTNKDLKKAIAALDTILVEMNKGVTLYTESVNRQKQRLQFASIVNSFMQKSDVLKKRVNLSGKQRMLTQRMTKLALLVSSNINKKENRDKLIKFSTLYDKTLNAFKSGDKDLGCTPSNDKDIKEQIAVIGKSWEPFYQHVKRVIDGKDSDGKSVAYMVENNEQLLKESNELVKRYEASNKSQNYLDKAKLHIVNVAGRQRMLTQKMTKEKLLIAKGNGDYSAKIEKTIKLFDDSLSALINGDPKQTIVKPTDKEIKNQLTKVSDIWKPLKPLYEKEKPTTGELAMIIKQNPILLAEMNKMVNMAETATEY